MYQGLLCLDTVGKLEAAPPLRLAVLVSLQPAVLASLQPAAPEHELLLALAELVLAPCELAFARGELVLAPAGPDVAVMSPATWGTVW